MNPTLPDPVAGTAKSRKMPIVVTAFQAERDIDTERIALVFNDREVRTLAGYRWSSPAPVLVQQALVRALDRSGAFGSVSDDTVGVSARYVVIGNIYAFQFRYAGQSPDSKASAPPEARLEGQFRLLDLQTGTILSSVTVSESAGATGVDVPSMMAAQEQVLSRSLGTVAAWLVGATADPRVRP
nr:ABC-type transport auxiliary lipoprotein family protein [Phaeovibrio sulfidiphilus]